MRCAAAEGMLQREGLMQAMGDQLNQSTCWFQLTRLGSVALITSTRRIDFKRPPYLVPDSTKLGDYLLFGSAGMCRIVKAPMVPVYLTGEYWTGLVGISANGDDGFDFLGQKFIHVLRAMSRNVDPDFPHYLDRLRMNITGRLGAGAFNAEKISSSRTQNAFGHMASAGIACAKDKDSWFHRPRKLMKNPRMPRAGYLGQISVERRRSIP